MTYDPKALERMAQAIGDLDKVPSQAAAEAAKKIEALIKAQFSAGVDPKGRPWAPLKNGGRSFLFKTGTLFGSIHVRPKAGAGIEVTVDAAYGQWHQTGTENMPARKILPEDAIPESWEKAISDAAEAAVRKRLVRI